MLAPNMTEVEAYSVTLYDKDKQFSYTIPQSQTRFNLSQEDIKLNTQQSYTISVSAINSVGYSPATFSTFGMYNIIILGCTSITVYTHKALRLTLNIMYIHLKQL